MEHQPRVRTSRRSRPSLAAFADSGYEPSRPATYTKRPTLHHSFSRSTNVSDEPDRAMRSQLLADMFTDPVSYREPKINTMRLKRSSYPFTYDGEGSSGTITANSRSGSSFYPRTNTVSRSATISSAWSGVSNRLFLESLRGAGNERQSNNFTDQFDKLAKKHGIQPFPHDYKAEPTSVSVSSASRDQSSGESTPTMHGNRFWNKLLGRTPSTIDVSKQHGNMKLTLTKRRHSGISDLAAIGRGKRDSLKGMHLEDMIRLGGVAIFNLPLGLAPGDLLIPTCIHAAAQFLLNNSLRTPGIFRVSGNLTTVYALYDFYQKQLEENNNEAVVATTALARLPSHIHYSIHDVAHLFRKLLHGLPGGLLGSPSVFQALYNIHRFVYPDPSLGGHMTKKVKPRMIALAISSVNLHFRIALICAVFGLLRAITLASEQEVETKVKDPHEMFAQIKEDALGIVFGPLLLGDKSDHILTEDLEDRGGLLVLPEVDPAGQITPKRSKSKSKIDIGYNKKQLEKTRRAAMVCQMLIDNWEDICYQMKRINTLSATAQAYDLPAQSGGEFRYVSEPSKKETMRDNSRQQTVRSQKSTQRSTGTERSTRPPEESVKHKHHPIHGHHISMPSFHGHHFHAPHTPDLPDLMRFSTRSSNDQDVEEPFSVPLITQQRTEMTPIVEMTPDRSLASPSTQESETSPNWRIRTEMTPIVEMTPVRSFATPSIQEPETSPNWRIIAPDEMETPTTPTRRYDINFKDPVMDRISLDHHSMDQESMHRRSVSSSSRGSSRLFGPSSSPPMEVLAEAAIRPRRELAPPFEESMVEESSVTEDNPESRNESMEPESPDQRSAFGRRVISRVPELSPQSEDTPGPEEEPNRPITPKPLSFRKKTTGSFSIFEDGEADKTPRAQQLPVDSPILTLTKPNSRGEIKLNPKGTRSSPTRAPPESPTRPQSVPLQPATPNRRPRASTMESDFEDRFLWDLEGETPSPKKLRGNSALYAEIRRLQRLVDAKNEEAMSTRKELELAKSMANAGTLSHLVRETQEELKVWKNRAEWAEKQLRERGIMGGRLQSAAPMVKGHAHRYSVS